MSCKVAGTTINLTRGDTAKIVLSLTTSDKEAYAPSDGDSIRFAMKKKVTDKSTLLLKEIPIDTMTLEIEPEETKSLSFGEYVYDIQVTLEDGTVDTVIFAKFNLTEEVE